MTQQEFDFTPTIHEIIDGWFVAWERERQIAQIKADIAETVRLMRPPISLTMHPESFDF